MASNAERKAQQRERDKAKGIVQVNLRVPAIYDVGLQLLAEDLRKGNVLTGFVMRDKGTGRIRTRIF